MPTLGTPIAPDLMRAGSCWSLQRNLNGYAQNHGDGLATQAAAGRRFRIVEPMASEVHDRVRVVLMEDGYPCWLSLSELDGDASACSDWEPSLLSADAIHARLDKVLNWLDKAAQRSNTYLWGGTVGPDLDCSGLVQTAFASAGIWLPRDAYQQERFCQPVNISPEDASLLLPGDLIFFGQPERCTHVGIHLGDGRYMHSSGREHGRNGIGIDHLDPADAHPVANHYRSELRGAGRVIRCHDGSTLP